MTYPKTRPVAPARRSDDRLELSQSMLSLAFLASLIVLLFFIPA
jgi:hypothetical protein